MKELKEINKELFCLQESFPIDLSLDQSHCYRSGKFNLLMFDKSFTSSSMFHATTKERKKYTIDTIGYQASRFLLIIQASTAIL